MARKQKPMKGWLKLCFSSQTSANSTSFRGPLSFYCWFPSCFSFVSGLPEQPSSAKLSDNRSAIRLLFSDGRFRESPFATILSARPTRVQGASAGLL